MKARPGVYGRRFAVPDHELNAFGELRASAWARSLQQTAIEASTDAGFPDDWYEQSGTLWVVRRTTIELREAAHAGETLEILTRVADFRRVRSQRDYEVRREGCDDLLAVATTDWVYVERASGRLARIPPEMIRGFVPDGEPDQRPRPNERFPPAPHSAFAVDRRVEFREIDALGHVNNASYIDYVEELLLQSLAAREAGLERLLSEGGYLRPRIIDVEYLDEARYGDSLRCLTWPGQSTGVQFSEIRRAGGGDCVTRARCEWAWIDLPSRRPAPFPAAIAAALRPLAR